MFLFSLCPRNEPCRHFMLPQELQESLHEVVIKTLDTSRQWIYMLMNWQNFNKTNPDICVKNMRNDVLGLMSHLTSPSVNCRKKINLITYHSWEETCGFFFFQISANISKKIVVCKVWCWDAETDQWQNPFGGLCDMSWNIKLFLLSAQKRKKYFPMHVMEDDCYEPWESRFLFKT